MTLVPLSVNIETKTEEDDYRVDFLEQRIKSVEREATIRVHDTERNRIYTYELHGITGQITTEEPSEFDRLFAEDMVATLERDRMRREAA